MRLYSLIVLCNYARSRHSFDVVTAKGDVKVVHSISQMWDPGKKTEGEGEGVRDGGGGERWGSEKHVLVASISQIFQMAC